MYNISPALESTYSEIGQDNPIRWEILYREDETTFTSQSGLIRCKDFFNELTRKYCSGQNSSIYRFDTKTIKLNDEGVYFRLHNITNMGVFEENLETTINVGLDSDFHVINERLNDTTSILFVPVYYFTSTYLTSLVSYVIRICNVNKKIGSFEDAVTNSKDVAIKDDGKKLAIKWSFNIPEKYQDYWYYLGDDYNNKTHETPDGVSMVHNNGVQSWSQYVTI
jgi:hypothetical protein